MENGTAPRWNAAVSTRWNSGRLVIISATVSPWPTPSPARPAATPWTRLAYSCQVSVTAPPGVRSATSCGYRATVAWNASHNVAGEPCSIMAPSPPSAGAAALLVSLAAGAGKGEDTAYGALPQSFRYPHPARAAQLPGRSDPVELHYGKHTHPADRGNAKKGRVGSMPGDARGSAEPLSAG